jgi:hypothetical protein
VQTTDRLEIKIIYAPIYNVCHIKIFAVCQKNAL